MHEAKETSKIRAVFDAFCASNGPSLDDCLYAGPNSLAKIFDILLRFKLNYIGILDITEAFLNVEIFAEHQKFLRFSWVDTNDPSLERTTVFQFLRVVFVITSSPFLLNDTIQHHFLKYEPAYPKFVEKFLEDLYVDDATSGPNIVTEGKKIMTSLNR